MRAVIVLFLCVSVAGCAAIYEEQQKRALRKTNDELCLAILQHKLYEKASREELASRGGQCDWANVNALARAQDSIDQAEQQRQAASLELQRQALQLRRDSGPYVIEPMQPSQARPVGGMAGFLVDQKISGNLRYCQYSNSVVTTVNVMNFCPQKSN